ncbi:hypothetical protein SRABI106_02859 [Rahnella aquatilis]|nr:hypothetical protein SRABI106_02859 [Rahnella aquatilis]
MQHAVLNLIGPELTGNLEGFVDFDRFGDIDTAVGFFRCVVHFCQRRVAGTGVVPAVGAFQRYAVQTLNHIDGPVWL